MSDVIRFTNGYLAMPDGTVGSRFTSRPVADNQSQAIQADLYISPSLRKIVPGQSHFYTDHILPSRTIDLAGQLLSPGLIDVQINGAFSVDFSELALEDEDEGVGRYIEGLRKVAKGLVRWGVTGFVPTVITQKEELYSKASPPYDDILPLSADTYLI
jgi:N-acetylglucosamine-6-phosphate deacetylase